MVSMKPCITAVRIGNWERLQNYGLRSRQIRYAAICIHLEHGRPYKTKESIERNRAIRNQVRNTKTFWTAEGIDKHIEKD